MRKILYNRFMINKDKKVVPITLFIAVAVYTYYMLLLGLNTVAVLSVGVAFLISLIIFISLSIKKKVSIYYLLSFAFLMLGNLLFYVIWGAEPFFERFLYNLLISSLAVAGLALILLVSKLKNIRRIFTAALGSLLVFSTLLFFAVMSIRVRPLVRDISQGQEDYLNKISGLSYSNDSPNILVILMDDMAYADISSYSYQENETINTPNIDSIGRDGVYMDNFYSCSPVCSPSRFGILTGRYQSRGYLDEVVFPTCVSLDPLGTTRHNNPFLFKNNVDGILGDEITIAEALQAYGYDTGLFGKWNLGDYGEYLPKNQGFDYFFGSYYVNDMTPYNIVREENGITEEVYSHYDMLDQSETTKILTDEIKGFIGKSIDNNEKFFAYYATPWPHYPIFSGEEGDNSDDCYIDCIEEFDSYLGELFDMLKQRGVYDDTLIIFTSDNGPGREGAAGALRGRKGTTFEGGQKVPMLACYRNGGLGQGVAFNGIVGNKHIESSAMNIDLFPTILQYVGINILPEDRIIDGVSLYDLLQGNVTSDTRVHDVLYYIDGDKVLGIQMPYDNNGVISDYKYYEAVRSENTAFFDQVYRNYLFNLDADPIEGYNISMKYPDIADTLYKKLLDFRKELEENPRGIK